MSHLNCLGPLVLALGLTAQPSLAQKTALTPLVPVRAVPQLPVTPGQAIVRQPMASASLPASTAVVAQQAMPLLLLESRMFIGVNDLSNINPQNIEKIVLYKGGDSRTTTPALWRGLDANGIIVLTLKKKAKLKSQTLLQLGRHLQARGPVNYTLNGLPVASSALRIATASIEEVKLARTATGTTVGVWLRSAPSPSQSTKTYPPGTIMIRGAAAYQPVR